MFFAEKGHFYFAAVVIMVNIAHPVRDIAQKTPFC
jgi:hypothetical protein